MTIADKLLDLYDIKNDLRTAIIGKGGVLTEASPFRDYAPQIVALPGAVDWRPVGLIDCSGELQLPDPGDLIAPEDAIWEMDMIYAGNGADIAAKSSLFTTTASASASSHLSSYVAGNAVDNNNSTYWSINATPSTWWQYDFGVGNAKRCYLLEIYGGNSGSLSCELRGSNDLTNWTVLGAFTTPGTAAITSYFGVSHDTKFRYIRLCHMETVSDRRLFEIDFYGVPVKNNFAIHYSELGTVTIVDCEFVRAGYTFDSWNTKADGSGDSYDPGDSFEMDEYNIIPRVLYAQWVAA